MATETSTLTPPTSSGSGAGYSTSPAPGSRTRRLTKRESPDRAHRSHHKPRKFSLFMKRLASLKSSSSSSSSTPPTTRGSRSHSFSHTQKHPSKSPAAALSRASSNTQISFAVAELPPSASSTSLSSLTTTTTATDAPSHHDVRTIASTRSRPAPSATTTLTHGARDSLFDSPAPSVRSLTTTLTTMTSTAPTYNPHASHHHNPNDPPVMYSAPFTATSAAMNADNASVWTLASSSRRPERRRSVDTDASVRALAPSSVWGGSRESLPLSVLSANLDPAARSVYANSTLGRSSTLPPDAGSITGIAPGPSAGGRGTPGPRSSLHSRRGSAWGLEGEEERRSEEGARPREDDADMVSVKDGSSSVGVWRGVYGNGGGGEATVV